MKNRKKRVRNEKRKEVRKEGRRESQEEITGVEEFSREPPAHLCCLWDHGKGRMFVCLCVCAPV